MKYFIFAVLAVFLAYPAGAELMTEAEAAAKGQAMMDELYRNPPKKETPEEWAKSDIEQVQKASREGKTYHGSGYRIADRDVYIDDKLYHCVEYQFNTQCHTH